MGAAAWLLASALESRLGTAGLLAQLATGLVPVGVGIVLYLGLTHALRVGEAQAFEALVFRRRSGR